MNRLTAYWEERGWQLSEKPRGSLALMAGKKPYR